MGVCSPEEAVSMSKTHRDPVREQFWRDTIAAWQASGLTVRAFCHQRQLKKTTFDYWRSELQRRDALAVSNATPMAPVPQKPKPPAFVPVTVLATPNVSRTVIEVRCPSGHVVTVPVGEEVTTLCHLFTALAKTEGAPC